MSGRPGEGAGDPAGDGGAMGGAPAAPADFTRVASLAELPPGTLKPIRAGDLAIALCNVEGEVYAVEDNCSHQHFPLSQSDLEDDILTCAWHGAQFDVRTGAPLALPAVKPVRTFEVRVMDREIYVRTAGEPPTPAEALVLRETLQEGVP